MKRFEKIKQNFRLVRPFITPYRFGFLGAILMVLLMVVTMVLAPSVEGMITTQLAQDASSILNKLPGAGIHFDKILKIMLLLAGIYGIKMLSQAFGVVWLTNSIQSAMHDMREAVQSKIHRLPVRYFDTHPYGDVLSRITNDVDTISNALQQTFVQIISGVLTLVLAITMMFIIRPSMAWMAVCIIPLSLLITRLVVRRSQKQFTAQQNAVGALNGAITEMYGGFNEILLYNKQKHASEKFRKINHSLRGHSFKAQFMSSLISPLISLVTYLDIGAVAVAGALFCLSGILTIGELQAFIRYIWQINDPLSQISQLSAQIQSAFAAMDRVGEILQEPEETPEAQPSRKPTHVQGAVSFSHVRFGYTDKTIIRDFNVEIKSGQMVAIVGPTGAGKTTLINLLLRFYDVNSGSISIDGVDIRDMPRESLRSIFGMVLQGTWLFSGTIFENIQYGRLNARRDEVIAAAKTANVHHFIRTLPEGYNTIINEEGSNISQGEKQLLTIARAVLKDPPILILDEATSSVDTRLEQILQEAMRRVMKGRTSFVIAHRLSTIRNADLILVVQNGDIVEQGNHETLMAQHGFYESLYNAQFRAQKA